MKKETFLMRISFYNMFELFTDEELGKLLRGVYKYLMTGEVPEMEKTLMVAFSTIRTTLDEDSRKYNEKCLARSQAGKKGMASRWGKRITNDNNVTDDITNDNKHNNVTDDITKVTNITDNDYDNDNDNDNYIEKENKEKDAAVADVTYVTSNKPVDTIVAALKETPTFIEYVIREHNDTTRLVHYALDEFAAYIKDGKGIDTYNPSEFRNHFMNWFRRNRDNCKEKFGAHVPDDILEKIGKLYPQNKGYMRKLFPQYVQWNNLTYEQGLEHFEYAYKKRMNYNEVLSVAQYQRKLLKNG